MYKRQWDVEEKALEWRSSERRLIYLFFWGGSWLSEKNGFKIGAAHCNSLDVTLRFALLTGDPEQSYFGLNCNWVFKVRNPMSPISEIMRNDDYLYYFMSYLMCWSS